MASGISVDYLKSLQDQTITGTVNSVIGGAIQYAQNITTNVYVYKSDLFNLVNSSDFSVVDNNIASCLIGINQVFYDSIVTVDISGASFISVTTEPPPTTFKGINNNVYTEKNADGNIYDSQGNLYTTYNTTDLSGNITFTVDYTTATNPT